MNPSLRICVAVLLLVGGLSCEGPLELLQPPATKFFFGPAFRVGTNWQFDYSRFYYSQPSCFFENRWGVHRWTILSVATSSQDTSYLVNLIRQDSVHVRQCVAYPGQVPYDTTYAVKEFLQFAIVISADTATFNWPSVYRERPTYAADSHRMPRVFSSSPRDSIEIGFNQSQYWHDYAIYVSSVGPVLYSVRGGGNTTWGESLKLTMFSSP